MRGIEQEQPQFYYHSESELELLIGEKLAVAVIQIRKCYSDSATLI